MTTISICVGSACHLKGAHAVLNIINALIERHQLRCRIELAGNFCRGLCTEGVVIQIDGEVITGVTPEVMHDIFREKVLGVRA